MNPANLFSYCAQVMLVVLLCAGLPRLLGLRAPGVHYAFWRTLLAVCLLLPLVQPWRPVIMVFVPAPGQPPPTFAAGPPPGPPPPGVVSPFDWTAVVLAILLAGIVARLSWIALGTVRLQSMRRRASATPAAGFADLQELIGTRVPIFWSPDARHPVTFGIFRPVVLLPDALAREDAAAQRAVLAHELHHVRRRDWLWVVVEEVIRSVFWFHPAMWWLISRVQLARETVVDELSILVTNARRTYLDTLLAFADDTGLASPPAFSARRHLFYRVMLLSKEGGMSSIRVALASGALTMALGIGAWSAVQAFPLYGDLQQEKAPPRDPLSPDALHRIAVEYYDKATKDSALTPDEKRQMVVTAISYEDRVLERNPDYVPSLMHKNVLLRMQATLTESPEERTALTQLADELRNKARTLRGPTTTPVTLAMTTEGIPASPEFQGAVERLHPLRVGGNIKTPTKTKDVRPVYPPEAQAARVQGVVILETLIDEDGKVAETRILRSIPIFDQAALESVRQWEFQPTLLNGNPTAVLMTVTVTFTLQ
jgi:TonB family protein